FSLKDAENREKFTQDEAAYCDAYKLTDAQKRAVLDRDWVSMIEKGGASIFYIIKLAAIDRASMQDLGGVFTGMTTEEFVAELRAGGRKFGWNHLGSGNLARTIDWCCDGRRQDRRRILETTV